MSSRKEQKRQRKAERTRQEEAETARKQRNSMLFWRSVLGMGAAVGVVAVCSVGYRLFRQGDDVHRGIEQDIKAMNEEIGLHCQVYNNIESRVVDDKKLDELTKEGVPKLLKTLEIRPGMVITNAILNYTNLVNEFEFLDKDRMDKVEEILPRISEIIEAGLKYWDHEALSRPDYEFRFLRNKEAFNDSRASFSQDRSVEIFAVNSKKEVYEGSVYWFPLKTSQMFRFSKPGRGESKRVYNIRMEENRELGLYFTRGPIIWANDDEEGLVSQLETPSVELLHLQLSVHTENAVGNEFVKLVKKGGYKGADALDKLSDDLDVFNLRYHLCEEYFVHGLHRLFFEQYVREHPELGIPVEGLGDKMGWNKPEVWKATEKIKRIGVRKAIDEYIKDPEWVLR